MGNRKLQVQATYVEHLENAGHYPSIIKINNDNRVVGRYEELGAREACRPAVSFFAMAFVSMPAIS